MKEIVKACIDSVLKWEKRQVIDIKEEFSRTKKEELTAQQAGEMFVSIFSEKEKVEEDAYESRNPFWKLTNGVYKVQERSKKV